MASLINDPNGFRRIQFVAKDGGSRPTIRLGKMSKSDASSIKYRVECLLTAQFTGTMDRDLSLWVSSLHPELREKLEKVGLLEPIEPVPDKGAVTVDSFLMDFMTRNGANKKPATRIVWGQVMKALREKLPEGICLNEVTAGHAKAFVESCRADELASSTIHKRVGFARQFFQDAVDWELIPANPFSRIKTKTSSSKSNVNVPMETIEKVLKHCDVTWGAVVALSRLGGLRTPSETLSLRWGDVDWENDRMHVPECKVEHHEGRGIREVPIFSELRPYLEAAFELATIEGRYPAADDYVIAKQAYRDAAMRPGGWANANLRTQFLKVLKRAKVQPWARLFHSMRASRETELVRDFPRHVVCAWLGNTEAVADKHYNLVTDEDFQKAAQKAAHFPSKAAQKAAQQVPARSTQGAKKTSENTGETCDSPEFSEVDRWRRRFMILHRLKCPPLPSLLDINRCFLARRSIK